MTLSSGVIVKWANLRPRGKDMRIINCNNKQTGNEAGRLLKRIEWVVDVVPGRDGPENLRILKRQKLRFNRWSVWLGFSNLIKADQFGSRLAEMSWDLRHHKMCRAWGCQHSLVSIGFYDLCLSGRQVLKAEINLFVFETTVSAWIIILVYSHFMSIQQEKC